MNIANLQKTLTIVSKYVDPEKNWCEAQHDIIYLPLMSNTEISTEDEAALDELGAFKDSEGGCWATFT